jgi:filamentous hemagglutinin family protein
MFLRSSAALDPTIVATVAGPLNPLFLNAPSGYILGDFETGLARKSPRIGGLGGVSAGSLVASLVLLWASPGLAQIVPDLNWGAESSRLNGDVIESGALRGNNLFHSFQQFNIDLGQQVFFANPVGVQNIFARVTGGTSSNIQGTLGVNGPANLYLLNPAGILFGNNAQLNLRGSFVGSTASGIQFGSQGSFAVAEPSAPGLLTIQPSALQFSQMAGNIRNQSNAAAGNNLLGEAQFGLRVPDGKSLLLMGGNITLDDGKLIALGGRIELGGLAQVGTVGLTIEGDRIQAQFPTGAQRAKVQLINNAELSVKGAEGEISVNAQQLDVENGGRFIGGLTLPSQFGRSGNIILNADTVNFNSPADRRASGIFQSADSGTAGQLGDVIINASQINWGNNAWIRNNAFFSSAADTGNILINGNSLVLTSQAPRFNFNELSQMAIQQDGAGTLGEIKIRLKDTLKLDNGIIFSQNSSTGGAIGLSKGTISIEAREVKVSRGAQLESSTRLNQAGGDIKITAGDLIVVEGEDLRAIDRETRLFSNILSQTGGSGKAGDILLTAPKIQILDRGAISNSVLQSGTGSGGAIKLIASQEVVAQQDSRVVTNVFGNGFGGNIEISTPNLSIRSGSLINAGTNAFSPEVRGGDLNVNAESIEVSGLGKQIIVRDDRTTFQPSGLSASSGIAQTGAAQGLARGGNLTINTNQLLVRDQGTLGSSTTGVGGNTVINARSLVLVEGVADQEGGLNGGLSIISTETFGDGDAGDLIINTPRLIVSNSGLVSSRAFFETTGDAGDLTINATEQVEVRGAAPGGFGSAILAETSGAGDAGVLTINTPQLNVSDSGSIRTSATDLSTGDGNDLLVNSRRINIANQGELSASSAGKGRAGNIKISSEITRLNQGIIKAVSNDQPGGNIEFRLGGDVLLLRQGSKITTQAGSNQSGGSSGGNISIAANFLVGLPQENSFITANAFGGKGGQVKISAQSILGIKSFSRPDLEALLGSSDLSQLDLSLLPSSITTISQRSPDLSGELAVQTLTPDPSQGSTDLPVDTIDATRKISPICPRSSGSKELGSFVVSGRGSLPPNPIDYLAGDRVIAPLARLLEAPKPPSLGAMNWDRKPGLPRLNIAACPIQPLVGARIPRPQSRDRTTD